MAAQPSPTVRGRRLALELRRLREVSQLTIDQVANALECSSSKISRIETSHVRATPRDVRDMLALYGVSGQQRDELMQMARDARQVGWWHSYKDLAPQLAALEASASSVRMYSAQVVPGLVQTPDYARALLRAIRRDLSAEELERRLELRMARQRVLHNNQPPDLWMVLDEAVLCRPIGSRQIMRGQLRRLLEATALPNVRLQVVPFLSGEHSGLDGSFMIIGFPEPADPDVVYLEHTTSDLYLEKPYEIRQYVMLFEQLQAASLRPEESARFITKLDEEMQ